MTTKTRTKTTLYRVALNIVLGVGVSAPALLTSNLVYATTLIGNDIESNSQTQTKYKFGYNKPKPKQVEPESEEEAAIRERYTPREEKQLPERLREYEMPERMDTSLIEKMNDDIKKTVNVLGKRLLNSEPTTKEIGNNKSNTQLLTNTIDMTEYFDMDAVRLQEEKSKITERYMRKEVSKEEIESQLESIVFPVTTSMKPTRMPASRMELSRDAKEAIPGTMIFIGMDEFSIEWFEMNLDEIRRFNPVGVFITQIDSVVDLRQLKRIAPDMNFIPTQSDDALKRFGVEFYPVMVTPEGIFQ